MSLVTGSLVGKDINSWLPKKEWFSPPRSSELLIFDLLDFTDQDLSDDLQ